MTAEEVLKYIQLVSRKSFIICHSGNDWKPEYEIEMKQIDQELALLRPLVDAEHTKRKEFERCSQQQKQYRWTEPVTGKRGTVYALSLVELREKEQQIQKDIQDGINTNSANMTLNQLFNIYMDGKANIRESTRCNYENDWNISVKQSILGDMKISQIKQIHVKKLYAELSKRNFKGSTIQTCHVLLSSVFQMAVDSDMLRKNPCKGCQKEIKVEPSQRQALTVKEQNILLDFVENSKTYNVYLPMLTFALSTALRIGEIIGLTWNDIDLKNNLIHVRRQLIYRDFGDGYKLHVELPKSRSGNRDISLTAIARKSLLKQKELDLVLGKRVKERPIDGIKGFVFITSNGTPILPFNFNDVLRNITNAYNKKESKLAAAEHREPILLPHITAHILRHTACTRMAEAGMDPKILQGIMGHSDISMTMNVYNHGSIERMQNEMKKLEKYM